MSDMISLVTLIITVVVFAACLVLAVKMNRFRRELNEAQRRIESLQNDMRALYTGAAGMGNHLARIESRIHNLSDRQEKLDDKDVVGQSFNEAITLAQRGVNVDELMKRCGLTREEAELMVRLHGGG